MFALDVPLRTLDAAPCCRDSEQLPDALTYDRRLFEAALAVGLSAGHA
jgi:hypothetical protein